MVVGWCWSVWLVILTIVGARCIKRVIAEPGDWTSNASKIVSNMEGDHGANQETR